MNHTELIAKVAEATNVNRDAAGRAVKAVADAIRDALAAGAPVRVAGLGIFRVAVRPAGHGRNLRTGETIPVAAKNAVRFRPGKVVKEAVNPLAKAELQRKPPPPRKSATQR
jgi:DNA-binding protein HU-beta